MNVYLRIVYFFAFLAFTTAANAQTSTDVASHQTDNRVKVQLIDGTTRALTPRENAMLSTKPLLQDKSINPEVAAAWLKNFVNWLNANPGYQKVLTASELACVREQRWADLYKYHYQLLPE